MKRIMYAILSILDAKAERICSGEITSELAAQGIQLSERTARYYLKILDKEGFTVNGTKKGRAITDKGRLELRQGFVSQRVGFIINKMNNLSFLMDFEPETLMGSVVLNISLVPDESVASALDLVERVVRSPYTLGERVLVAKGGNITSEFGIPSGLSAIGTVCSVTLNGIFLKAGIPVCPKYGGIVQMENAKPVGFHSFISYDSTSVAPLEVFIKSGMTEVIRTLDAGNGSVLGSFQMIPENCAVDARRVAGHLADRGFKNTVLFGQAGKALLGIPVPEGRVGLVVLGGLNPHAALKEAGISVDIKAMAMLHQYQDLKQTSDFTRRRSHMHFHERVMAAGTI